MVIAFGFGDLSGGLYPSQTNFDLTCHLLETILVICGTKPQQMPLPNVFSRNVSNNLISRINTLTPDRSALWGKMDPAQMLAHCNISYEMVYEDYHHRPNVLMRMVLQILVKPMVVSEVPYKKGSRTAPAFLVTGKKDFEQEKSRIIAYLNRTQALGETAFDGTRSLSFGRLTNLEWNNLFYKHLDHHLQQFDC